MGVEEYPQRFFPQGFPQKGAVEKERMRSRKKGTYKDVKVCKRHVYMYETGFCNGDMCFIWGRHKLLAAQFRAGKFTRGNCIRLLKNSSHSKGDSQATCRFSARLLASLLPQKEGDRLPGGRWWKINPSAGVSNSLKSRS